MHLVPTDWSHNATKDLGIRKFGDMFWKLCFAWAVLAPLVYPSSATQGSISRDLFHDDVKDEPHAEFDDVDKKRPGLIEEILKNPCHAKKCYRGEVCTLKDNTEAECVCNTDCSLYEDAGFQVCSNANLTYTSECNLNKDHCLCKHNLPGCSQPGVSRIYVEYYGICREQPKCPEDEALQFPERLRDWIFLVMETMAKRAALGEYVDLVPREGWSEHHAHAVIWKFCSLDQDPQDRHVSKRELQYTVRSLRAMEGCLMPFLDECDRDGDTRITLREWGRCLGLEDTEITNRCQSIHQHIQGTD
ncbi:hypothetical protein RRG08_050241 [Elysia crispata]|uniref:SPARC/Testican calcium-binding domain-containing protein n=1 Tax=Elysia crispata TaxID=231223 RepID=A0AAE1B3F1_9GAST|nr:hypothetical protein RRG08_050241 [Elysia crispata]